MHFFAISALNFSFRIMAPSSLAQQMSQLHAVSPLAKKLWRRDIFAIDSVLVAPLVFLTILSAIAFAGLAYLTWKAWNCATGEEDVEAALTIPAERRLSYWIRQNIATRQNSNVVWATQVDEENVDFQFSEPSKSRFSEDSNDSVDFGRCPLDRSHSFDTEDEKASIADEEEDENEKFYGDLAWTLQCRRAPVQSVLITAWNKGRAMSQPFLHQLRDHVDEVVSMRKHSLPYHQAQVQI